jgi:hypothetical protein
MKRSPREGRKNLNEITNNFPPPVTPSDEEPIAAGGW